MRSKGKGNQIFMADRDPRTRRPVQLTLMARKSAPVSAGGINARRLEQWRLAAMAAEREEEEEDEDYVDEGGEEGDEDDEEEESDDGEDDEEEEEEEEEKEPNNQCGNPFCRQSLANRYARFCEDKPLCQRYRALKLQCLANAQAEEEEEDTRPLALVIMNKKKKKEEKEKKKEEEPFAIPRRKKTEIGGKRRLNLNATAAPVEERSRSNSNSPREMVKRQKKRETDKRLEEKEKEEKRQRKKLKRARETAGSNGTKSVSVTSNSPSVQGSSVSSEEEFVSLADELKTRIRLRDPRTRPPPDASNNAEARAGLKKRRLSRHVSADDVLSRSASSSPGTASAAVATDTNWKIPRAKPGKKTTAVQAIRRSMNVELVPLGVTNKANLAGGGRYVQNGNRTAAPSLRPSDPRPRPPTKFVSPAPATKAPPAAPAVVASSRPMPTARSSVSAPPPAPTRPPPLPPLPPQAPSLPPPAPRPIEPAQMVTPSSSPVRTPAIVSNSMSSTARATAATSAAPTGPSRIKRISASDYRKSRQDNVRGDQLPSRSSSLERSSDLPGERPSAYPAAPSSSSYTSRPEYRRSDSAPLSSSSSSSSSVLRQRELGANLDPRRQYPDSEDQFRRQQPYYEGDGGRMEYQDRSSGRGEFQSNGSYSSGPGQWEGRSYQPPRDHYPPRHQEPSSFGASNGRDGGSFDYAMDTHFSPASSPPDQSFRRENQREDPPLPLRAPSPRRSEPERVNGDRRTSDFDDLDDDAPTFSYNEVFLPQLLSIFIHKFPPSLDAISNVTKKPRKMNWYIKYVERIQRLCQPHDVLVKLEGTKAVVTVRGREWIALQGTSTITLYMDVLKRLQAEALTWLTLYEEMESALQHYRGMYGSQTNESYAFLRAWNDLKRPGSYISVPRQANYFCGARLHHWNFVVGKVEIGSGSHEDKREAFRLATVSALDFLLSAGRGTRRRSRPSEVKRERSSETTQPNERRQHRSSSRESFTGTRVPPNSEPAGEASAEALTASGPPPSTAPTPAPVDSSASSGQPTVVNSTPSTKPQSEVSTTEPPSTAEQAITTTEPSSSPVTVEPTEEEPAVSVIPTTDSVSSSEVADAAEQSDPGEEMSISDASDPGAITPAGSPLLPTTHASSSVPLTTPGSAVTVAESSATSSVAFSSTATESSVAPLPSTVSSGIAAMVAKLAAAAGVSTAPNSQSTAKTTVPARRCMMCEMIRMRKPDGERCLRCQQKDAPANGLLGSSLDP